MQNDAQWHWGEGTKYATELIKSVVIINGAAAVSILTFIGNTRAHYVPLIVSMLCFAVGVAVGACTQGFAYLAQLHYGNASQRLPSDPAYNLHWREASKWHWWTYVCAIGGLALFVLGVLSAAIGLTFFNSK
jgi:hypothetical protein